MDNKTLPQAFIIYTDGVSCHRCEVHRSMPSSKTIGRLKVKWETLISIIIFCGTLLGQSRLPTPQGPTFQVQGKILAPPGAEVTFESDLFKLRVVRDVNSAYKANLPLGLYTMTVRPPSYPLLQKLERPIFRVASPTKLTLNPALWPSRETCDIGMQPSREEQEEAAKNACGYDELFDTTAMKWSEMRLICADGYSHRLYWLAG